MIAPDGRRWTLAREAAAGRYAEAANRARTPAALRQALAAVDAETAPAWYQRALRERAAGALLDAAAVHCFDDPVRAADVVRWSRLRHQDAELAGRLAAGPASFSSLRAEREHPAVWDALPEPRHEHVPAWLRFRAAAETWLRVHAGESWEPPSVFPTPPAPPAAFAQAGPAPSTASSGNGPEHGFGITEPWTRRPGLSR